MESSLATFQTERLDRQAWRSREKLRTAIFYWIEVTYNRRPRHSTLGMFFPQRVGKPVRYLANAQVT